MLPPDAVHDVLGEPEGESDFTAAYPLGEVEEIECWRCGKSVPLPRLNCPACGAKVDRGLAPAAKSPRSHPASRRMLQVIGLYALLFFPIVVCSAAFLMADQPPDAEELLLVIGTLEAIDTVLVLVGLVLIVPPELPPTEGRVRGIAVWGAALPLLAVMLSLNFAYFHILTEWLGIPTIEDELMLADDLLPWVILTITIQPAIVEEIFFRHTALLTMRESMGETSAIWTTGVMFGFAHIGNPFGIPYLILYGVFQGYVRVRSGSLVLPMILHFLHNLVVVFIERLT